MIELSALEEMFQNIREKTPWNIDGPMLWGYFFTNKSPEKLELAASELQNFGYRYVNIYVPDLDEDEDEYFFLHMEREETHSVSSLYARNQELDAFAEACSLDSYDGMDVGPIQD